jgi:hypothetical protein
MKTTHADTTKYDWDKSYFEAFASWLKTNNASDLPLELLVIDWIEENNLNAGKRFFGVSIKHADSEASLFVHQYYKYFDREKQINPDLPKASGSNRAELFEKGYSDGYWKQPEKSDNDDYKAGYVEGFNKKTLTEDR